MTYFTLWICGAFILQTLTVALAQNRAHPELSRRSHFFAALVIALAWPILAGCAIRNFVLGRNKIPKPKFDA